MPPAPLPAAPRRPAAAYNARPKARPGDRGADTHDLLAQDRDIRVINAATGELLRELTLDPARDYQPTGRPPGPKPKRPRTH